ncbi:MAG: NAD-dependent epimerase/dehydratase family protein [Candidatus Neomarinimicrobiota bacterium]
MKKALVLGCGGFIAHHLVNRLKEEGFWVKGADLKYPRFSETACDEFLQGDLRDQAFVSNLVDQKFDEIYQLAADMGGAGYIFTGENDADVMTNSALINLNILDAAQKSGSKRIFYSSSACIYPEYNQLDPDNPKCSEDSAYPAAPDSEYGWEKLFSERMYASYARNKAMEVRVARYHNIYGPEGSWNDGKEKAPAALCRKVAMANNQGEIEVWGDGVQTRSFLYIDDSVDATIALTRSEFEGPVNIGSEEMISINNLALLIADVSGKKITINNIPGPEGVRGRNSDNKLIGEKIGWQPKYTLRDGIEKTYPWIDQQVKNNK